MTNNNTSSIQEPSPPLTEAKVRGNSLRNLLPYILATAGLFLVSLVVGLRVSPEFASGTIDELKLSLKFLMESLSPFVLLFIIFLNNAIKALGAIVLGITLGLPPIFFICANGFIVGVAITALKSSMGYGVIAASLLPHGIIEIPLLLVSAALGLRIGWESLRYLIGQKSSVRAQLRYGVRIYLKWILAGLFVAAIIEVFITPLFIFLIGGKELFMK